MDPQQTNPAAFANGLAVFDIRIKESAFSLYTLVHISPTHSRISRTIQCTNLAKSFLALSAVLTAVQGLISIAPAWPVLGAAQLETLEKGLRECLPILDAVDRHVKEASRGLFDGGIRKAEEEGHHGDDEYIVGRIGEEDAIQTVRRVFRNVVTAVTAGRAECLGRRGYLTDDEVFEGLRLRNALEHNSYNEIPELTVSPPMPFLSPVHAHSATSDSSLMPPPPLPPPPIHLSTFAPRPPSPPPYQSRDIIDLQHPKGFRGRYGHPNYPLLEKQPCVQLWPEDPRVKFEKSFEEEEVERYRLSADGKYPDIAAFGVWPPVGIAENSVQDRQLKAIMATKRETQEGAQSALPTSSTGTPVATPNSTRESTPAGESDKETVVDASEITSVTAENDSASQEQNPSSAVNEAEEIKEEEDNSTSEVKDESKTPIESTRGAKESKGKQSTVMIEEKLASKDLGSSTTATAEAPTANANPFTIPLRPYPSQSFTHPQHLEAHILRPLCEDVYNVTEWNYKIEQLPIADSELEAHIRKLGPNHSVIDDIGALLPEQLRLIQIRAKNRAGHIVSAQYGRPADMVTKMGTFQVKPVVFVLKTEKKQEGLVEQENKSKQKTLFSNAAQQPAWTGFDNNPGTASSFGSFGANAAPPSALGTNSAFGGFKDNTAHIKPTEFPIFPQNGATSSNAGARSLFGNSVDNSSASSNKQHTESTKPAEPTPASSASKPGSVIFGSQAAPAFSARASFVDEGNSVCTHRQTETNPPIAIAHHQILPVYINKAISFEELRVSDRRIGRTGPEKSVSIPGYPEEYTKSSSTTISGGLFGGTGQSSSTTGGLFGQAASTTWGPFGKPTAASGGLFGGSTITSGGGLFGKSTSTSGGLFGQPTSAPGGQRDTKTGGLFGTSNNSNTSPFGSTHPSTPVVGGLHHRSGLFAHLGSQNVERSTPGLFGNSRHVPAAGIFGASQRASSSSGPSSGAPTAPSGGLFGASQPAQPTAQINPFGTYPSSSGPFFSSTSNDNDLGGGGPFTHPSYGFSTSAFLPKGSATPSLFPSINASDTTTPSLFASTSATASGNPFAGPSETANPSPSSSGDAKRWTSILPAEYTTHATAAPRSKTPTAWDTRTSPKPVSQDACGDVEVSPGPSTFAVDTPTATSVKDTDDSGNAEPEKGSNDAGMNIKRKATKELKKGEENDGKD